MWKQYLRMAKQIEAYINISNFVSNPTKNGAHVVTRSMRYPSRTLRGLRRVRPETVLREIIFRINNCDFLREWRPCHVFCLCEAVTKQYKWKRERAERPRDQAC